MKVKYDISFLKSHLEKANITKTYLAEELGVTLSSISTWLNGICSMPEEYLPKLLKVFKANSYEELRESMVDIYRYVPDIKKINKDLLFRLLAMQDSSSDEYIIAEMLFGGFCGRYYPIEEIEAILHVSKKYVLDTYYKYVNIISIMEKEYCTDQEYLLSMNNFR